MDKVDLNMLSAIAEKKNVTRAAEYLCIAQSSLSYRLKRLENEFNANLLIRTPRGVIFTPEGESLLQCVRNIQEQLRKTKESIQNMKGTIQGELRIAVTAAFARYELPDILKNFLKLYPQVEVFLKTSQSHNVYRMLQKGEVSIAIIRGDHPWLEEKRLIATEPICLVSGSPLEICDLPNRPQIIHPLSGVHNIAETWWRQNFASPPYTSMEVDNMDIGLQMVLRDLGWAIIPVIGLKGYTSLYTKGLTWKNGNPLVRKTWLMCRNSSLELSVVQAFVEYVNDCVNVGDKN
ncbi:MAG: LysR family transcriptional regulator [Veillonellales bacterium]